MLDLTPVSALDICLGNFSQSHLRVQIFNVCKLRSLLPPSVMDPMLQYQLSSMYAPGARERLELEHLEREKREREIRELRERELNDR